MTTALPTRPADRVLLGLAVLLHLGAGVFYAASGLLAPLWAVVGLWAVWGALLVVLVRLGGRRAPLSLLVPPAALALWWLAITAGEQLLGWTG